jgi:tetratricopeptide (TPR) repeat protein
VETGREEPLNELDTKRRADDFVAKGRYSEAISEYQSMLSQLKKPNPAILNLIGDLYVKQGDFEKGFESYLRAARGYAEEGLFHNGIAVGKKILRLDKDQIEVYGMLGLLYARQGLGMDCVKFLNEYGRRKEKAGEFPAVLASFAEACEILSDFPDVHVAYGEMLEGVDRKEDASVAFERAASAFAEREMQPEAASFRRRALALRGAATSFDDSRVRGMQELMNLRTLEDAPRPPARRTARTWSVFDPSANPDLPPPPPLPRRPGAKRVEPRVEPAVEPAVEPMAEPVDEAAPSAPRIYEIPVEAPTTPSLPVAAEAPAEPDPYALELEPRHASFTRNIEEAKPAQPAPAPERTKPSPPAASPDLTEFFETAAGAASERAVIVGDDFELVREGGDVFEVVNDFREATMELLDLDDHQSHYDLGTTYMEMELFDEAAAEFEISARGTAFALPSQEMLGYCFLRKGQIDLAIRELKKGLAIQGHDDRDKLGLLYNLGVACRVVDRESEAIDYFKRILEIDPDFRDTKSRLDRLVSAT